MTTTLILSDACAAELRAALAVNGVGTPMPTPQPVPPSGPIAGYDRVLRHEWDWSRPETASVNTNVLGGIGPNGLLVIAFNVPQSASGPGNVSVTAYPGDIRACERIVSIGPEGDFTQPFPWTRTGPDAGIQFDTGWATNPRSSPLLIRGGRYHINIASPGCANAGRACDYIVTCSRP